MRTAVELWLAMGLFLSAAPVLADPLANPPMTGPLSASPTPFHLDAGSFGKIYLSGAVSAIGLVQDNATPGDRGSTADLSNGQIIVQKIDGVLQFYVQAGTYALPALGTPYWGLTNSAKAGAYFGAVPEAYVKLQATPELSVQLGKLPTLVGAEYTFTVQNMTIERGLLWSQEPAVSQGLQVNYATGPWALSVSLNDGYYSDKYDWLSGSMGYTFSPKDSLTFIAAENFGASTRSTVATPLLQNNSAIYNLIWTHTAGAWIVTPYLQYSAVPTDRSSSILKTTSSFGGAVIAKYSFNKLFSLAGRAEYIDSTGAYSLLYGPKSKAWSLTLTPTVQVKSVFVRGEMSYTQAADFAAGAGFGARGGRAGQARAVIETGLLF